MPTERFYYSRWYAWYPYGNTAMFGSLIYYNAMKLAESHHSRLFEPWEYVFIVAWFFWLIWHFVKYLLPMLQKKPYLEIDGEKITLVHKRQVFYGHEIEKATAGFFGNSLILKLKNKRKARIYLNCMRGDNGDIAKAILTAGKVENSDDLSRYII